MKIYLSPSPPRSSKRMAALGAVVALVVLSASAACQSSGGAEEGATRGVVIVNAPATGEVRRVLVREGMSVDAGTPVVEIAVRVESSPSAPPQVADPQARARENIGAAQTRIETARAEAVRTEVEVQRLTPLAASGDVPQAQLDGARAEYERAQQRLQGAISAEQGAQSGLIAARQQAQNATTPGQAMPAAQPVERLVMASATSAGTVSVINARIGERVTAGQPLATLRAGPR